MLRRLRIPLLNALLNRLDDFTPNARLFLLATVISGITFAGFNLFFNFYILARGFDRDFLGLVNAIPSGAALVVGVPMGMLSDRIGRRRAMLIGMSIATLALWIQITALSPALILIMAAVQGIASSLYYLSTAPFMMTASNNKNRALLFSLNFGLQTLAGFVGNLFAGQLPGWFAQRLGVGAESAEAYQAVLLASIIGGAFMLVPILFIREARWPGPRQVPPLAWADLKQLVRPMVIKLAVPNAIIGFGAATLIPYMNVFFKTRFAIPDSQLGMLFSLSAITVGVASIIAPRLAERLGSKIKAVVMTQGLSLLFLLILGFTPVLPLAALAFLARGALMNMSSPLYSAFTMEQVAERERGAVNSMLQMMWEIGWTVGPYLSGVVQQRYGFTPLFLSTATLYGVAIWLTWTFFGKAEATSPELQMVV